MGRKSLKPLGAVLKVSEVERVINAVCRLDGVLKDAVEENNKLRSAFELMNACGKMHCTNIQEELYKLMQSGQWLSVLLGGCEDDVEYIKSHLNCIVTLLRLEAAKKLDKQEGK